MSWVFRLRKSDFSSLRQWWDYGKIEFRLLRQKQTFNVTRDIAISIKDMDSGLI